MNKHRKDRYTRLSIVASQDKQPSRRQTPQRLWVTQSAGFFKASNAQPAAEVSAGNRRMTVMPKLSRGWALSIVANLGNCIRSYFVNGPARQRRAAVLSFRRHAFRMHGEALTGENFAGRKANGNVCWSSGHEVAPQEGGRA